MFFMWKKTRTRTGRDPEVIASQAFLALGQ
jgi:hypothetical protein